MSQLHKINLKIFFQQYKTIMLNKFIGVINHCNIVQKRFITFQRTIFILQYMSTSPFLEIFERLKKDIPYILLFLESLKKSETV